MIEVKDLHVRYGAIHAIRGVSLRVGAGEIVTLIGANGAGKSTILRTISGLLRPSAGDVLFEGKSIAKTAPHEIVRRGLAHIPEGRIVFANMSVQENLELGAYLRRDKAGIRADRERVFDLFPRLRERLHQAAGTLSGGEQQMLAIGRGLLSRPRLLLMDEPSLGLAPLLVQGIFEIVRTIHAGGTPILLVEQNARQALRVADRAYVLETGGVVLEGPAARVAADPRVREAYLGGE